MSTILVTGGAGFIGSALVRHLIAETSHTVVNLDKLTYAGSTESVDAAASSARYRFIHADICDARALRSAFAGTRPNGVIHLAAESHVDRSIDGPDDFVRTNLVGTYTLLQEARRYWESLPQDQAPAFRFLHVSTDEVFGSLGADGFFSEETRYDPSSPYSASKAGSDHLVRAWHRTYGLPVTVTNCSNNYGPFQLPEKLIPLTIGRALAGEPLPVYGTGDQVRDWLYVDDHVHALHAVLEKGLPGRTYSIGGGSERRNIDVVRAVCSLLDEMMPDRQGRYERLVEFVADRPGHDFRYAVDTTRIAAEIGWHPRESFDSGLRKTVRWYLANLEWLGRAKETVRR